jgi:hypothetical protein
MADVYALDERWVVKLDRPDFRGVAPYEADIVQRLAATGLPVPMVRDVVEIDDRTGFVMERLQGPTLLDEINDTSDPEGLADRFVELHRELNSVSIAGLPELVSRLASEIAVAGLAPDLAGELTATLDGSVCLGGARDRVKAARHRPSRVDIVGADRGSRSSGRRLRRPVRRLAARNRWWHRGDQRLESLRR